MKMKTLIINFFILSFLTLTIKPSFCSPLKEESLKSIINSGISYLFLTKTPIGSVTEWKSLVMLRSSVKTDPNSNVWHDDYNTFHSGLILSNLSYLFDLGIKNPLIPKMINDGILKTNFFKFEDHYSFWPCIKKEEKCILVPNNIVKQKDLNLIRDGGDTSIIHIAQFWYEKLK